MPSNELVDRFGTQIAFVTEHHTPHYLAFTWIGFFEEPELIATAHWTLQWVNATGCTAVLMDNRQIEGSLTRLDPEAVAQRYRDLYQAGIRRLARVLPADKVSTFYFQEAETLAVGTIEQRSFGSLDEAVEWLTTT
jgi:hypothetical protein